MIGGTNAINTMIYMRGNKHDYDQWADAGNSGWSYQECLPYFKKLENIQVESIADDRESFKSAISGLFFVYFWSFQTTIQFSSK